jgi:hypothetical protein
MTKREFRYDEEHSMLQWVTQLDEQMIQDNLEWNAKFGHDLWESKDGYCVIHEIGLSSENWHDAPGYWVERFNEEIDWELQGR